MLIQQLINGLTLGLIYSLLALGYSMIFGTLRFINFSHGPVSAAGAYVAWIGYVRMGLPLLLAALIGVLFASILGVTVERVGYKPVRRSKPLIMIIISVGFAYIIQIGLEIIFGSQAKDFSLKNFRVYTFGQVYLNSVAIWIFAVSIGLMICLQLFIRHTRAGTSIRAVSLDKDTSALMGVNVDSAISLTFVVGSALGSVSAIMLSVFYSQIYPTMGSSLGTMGFAGVVLGGVGSIPGAMLGGILMGLIESLAAVVFNTQISQGVAFVVLILILIIKPSGLLGKEVVKD